MGVYNTAVDLHDLLFELLVERVEGLVVCELLLDWSVIAPVSLFMLVCLLVFFDCLHWLLFMAPLVFIIFYIELNPSKFYNISPVQLVVEVVLRRLCVPHNHKHFVVDILVCNRVAIFVNRSFCDKSIVLNLKHSCSKIKIL